MGNKGSHYDREADIAYFPTGQSDKVRSREVAFGLIDHDAETDEVVGVEVHAASTRLPKPILDALPDARKGIENPIVYCPKCNTLSDWGTGQNWKCDLCDNRGTLPLSKVPDHLKAGVELVPL